VRCRLVFSFGLHVDPFLSSVSNLPQDVAADCWWRPPSPVHCCRRQSLTRLSRHSAPKCLNSCPFLCGSSQGYDSTKVIPIASSGLLEQLPIISHAAQLLDIA